MNVTVATEMVRKNLLKATHEGYDQTIEEIRPGSDGLILLPYLEGERMPSVPHGSGVLLGLRPSTSSPPHLARAAVEGVTMGLRYGLDRMRQLGLNHKEIRLIGGGARSPAWRQIVADIFNLPVVSPGVEEGPAFGAALQAAWCKTRADIGDLTRQHVTLDEKTRRLPKSENVGVYQDLYKLYKNLSGRLIQSDLFPQHRHFVTSLPRDFVTS
jgi:xylulokinase